MTEDAIRCIDCGIPIAQYEHVKEDFTEWWGYQDTIERISSGDSLRCGRCYQRYAFGSKDDLQRSG
uniref:Putative RNA polymerase n=1 Tax=viral metagenome TaxID=1070528 RepID=A0A6M3JG09_9ZZZZ